LGGDVPKGYLPLRLKKTVVKKEPARRRRRRSHGVRGRGSGVARDWLKCPKRW